MKDFALLALGAVLAAAGGAFTTWLQARFARRIRMDELIAEKKIEACTQAYPRIKEIESLLIQSTTEDVRKKMHEYELWFFDHRLFLPERFANKWLGIRLGLGQSLILERETPETADRLTELWESMREMADGAVREIEHEIGIDHLAAEIPQVSAGKSLLLHKA